MSGKRPPATGACHFSILHSMNPDSDTPGTFGYWLRLSMEEIAEAGYQVTMEEDRMPVFGK